MKKMSELMIELGFRPEAPENVKEAFIQHLIHASTGQRLETPTEKREKKKRVAQALQLEFDFSSPNEGKKTG
jgi:hypothetical protein